MYVCLCACMCLCLCMFGTLNGNYAAPVAEKNTGRVCRILLFDLGFSSFIPFKCHVAATHVCAYTQIHPLYVCHIHVCSTQIWPAAKLRFLLLYFMLVLLLQSRALLLLVLLPKPGNETLMRVKLIQMRFLSACRCPSHCPISPSLPPLLPYPYSSISNWLYFATSDGLCGNIHK